MWPSWLHGIVLGCCETCLTWLCNVRTLMLLSFHWLKSYLTRDCQKENLQMTNGRGQYCRTFAVYDDCFSCFELLVSVSVNGHYCMCNHWTVLLFVNIVLLLLDFTLDCVHSILLCCWYLVSDNVGLNRLIDVIQYSSRLIPPVTTPSLRSAADNVSLLHLSNVL